MNDLYQAELLPKRFTELLNGPLSTRVAYRRSTLCPCQGATPTAPDPKCPHCKGIGYFWTNPNTPTVRTVTLTRAPLPGHEHMERLEPGTEILLIMDEQGETYPPSAVTIRPDGSVLWDEEVAPAQYTRYTVTSSASASLRAGVQGIMGRREFQVRGEYEVLDLEMTLDRHLADGVTLNPAWDCGEFDRFSLLDQWRRHAQHVINGPKYNRVLYRQMRSITVVSTNAGQLQYWQEGQDFTFQDGAFTWQPGRGPKLGAQYTVQGEVNPEYYVFQALPQTRQADAHPLPRRIVLKGFERFPNRRPDDGVL